MRVGVALSGAPILDKTLYSAVMKLCSFVQGNHKTNTHVLILNLELKSCSVIQCRMRNWPGSWWNWVTVAAGRC